MKSDLPEYFSIFAHGDVIFELAAPPKRREARCASSSNVRSARNNNAPQT